MASKKKNPAVQKRISDRKAFVKDKVSSKGINAKQARQRFYVQTRLAELKAAGKPVGAGVRKALQKKFQSGDVSRKGHLRGVAQRNHLRLYLWVQSGKALFVTFRKGLHLLSRDVNQMEEAF